MTATASRDACPKCGTPMETARHYRGGGVYLVEERCPECGHYEVGYST